MNELEIKFKRKENGQLVITLNGEPIDTDILANLVREKKICACSCCDTYIDTKAASKIVHNNNTYFSCRKCSSRYGGECFKCEEQGNVKINLSSYTLGPENSPREIRLCSNCANNAYSQCNRCGYLFDIDTLILHEGRRFCDGCAGRQFPKCKYCDKRHLGKNICRCKKNNSDSFLPGRYFSTELEIVDMRRESTTKWHSVNDSSISSGGIEYLSGPMVGKFAVDEIYEECGKLGGFVDDTCGFHIHLDFGDESEENVRKYAIACQKLESFAFSIVKNNRKDSRYCKKYTSYFLESLVDQSKDLDEVVYNSSNERQLTEWKRQKYQEMRYHWYNLHSFFFRGTIEMRQHHGTMSPDVILRWAELWLKVADWSSKNAIDNVINSNEQKIIESIGLRSDTLEYFNNKKLCFNA